MTTTTKKPRTRKPAASTKSTKTAAKRKPAKTTTKKAAPKTTTVKKQPATKAKAEKKLSQLDAAAIVLGKADAPMNCMQMVNAMTEQGLWTSDKGLTPWATLSAAIRSEIKKKGAESRFAIAGRGLFQLAKGGAK